MGIFVKSIAAMGTDEEQRERSRRRNELCVYIYTRTVLLSFSFPFALLAVANLLSWVVGLFYAARKKKRRRKRAKLYLFTSMEYDALVYPGFLRQPMGKWLEDGTCAPSGRARGKADLFTLALPRNSIEADIAAIEHEQGSKKRGKK